MPHIHVCHDSFTRVIWNEWFTCVTWPIHMCGKTHSYVRHNSFIRVTWFIRMCGTTHSYVCHRSFTCVVWLVHMCGMIHSCVWYEFVAAQHSVPNSFVCVPWLNHMRGMTRSHVWHDSFLCVTRLSSSQTFSTKRVLQYIAMCRSVWQRDAVWCSVKQCDTVWCSVLQYIAVCCSALQCFALCCSALQFAIQERCSALQCIALQLHLTVVLPAHILSNILKNIPAYPEKKSHPYNHMCKKDLQLNIRCQKKSNWCLTLCGVRQRAPYICDNSHPCRTKSVLEYWGCRTRQPERTWLLGPWAILVLIQNHT